VTLDYDEIADVLYVTFGQDREAYCVEPEEGVLLRVDPETRELAGLTILHLSRRLAESGSALFGTIPLLPLNLSEQIIQQCREHRLAA